MLAYSISPRFGETEARHRSFPYKGLVHLHQTGRLEFGDMAGKVPFGKTGEPLQIEEVGVLTGSQGAEDGQTGWFVNESIELGQLLEGLAHRTVSASASLAIGGSRRRSSK